jgi:hypothetical protein
MERNDAFSSSSQIRADIISCIQWDISNLLEVSVCGLKLLVSAALSY